MFLCNYEDVGDGVNAALRYSQDLGCGKLLVLKSNKNSFKRIEYSALVYIVLACQLYVK